MANREKYRIPGQVYGKQRSRCCFAVCHRRIQGFFFFPFPFSSFIRKCTFQGNGNTLIDSSLFFPSSQKMYQLLSSTQQYR